MNTEADKSLFKHISFCVSKNPVNLYRLSGLPRRLRLRRHSVRQRRAAVAWHDRPALRSSVSEQRHSVSLLIRLSWVPGDEAARGEGCGIAI